MQDGGEAVQDVLAMVRIVCTVVIVELAKVCGEVRKGDKREEEKNNQAEDSSPPVTNRSGYEHDNETHSHWSLQ